MQYVFHILLMEKLTIEYINIIVLDAYVNHTKKLRIIIINIKKTLISNDNLFNTHLF